MLKSDLRKAALADRAATPEATRAAFQAALLAAIPAILASAPKPRPSVAGFWPVRHEPDGRPLLQALHARGCQTCLPCVKEGTRILTFRRWQPEDSLQTGRFGISEPLPKAPTCVPDVVLVPCAAVDTTGHRVGYGGGFYDATLAALRVQGPVVALALAFGLHPPFPIDPEDHDQKLDGAVTVFGLHRFP